MRWQQNALVVEGSNIRAANTFVYCAHHPAGSVDQTAATRDKHEIARYNVLFALNALGGVPAVANDGLDGM